ncbi:hypothetical protein bthur0013_55680 [Bacillus thuringiensis IBL 200]|nr:hypothetical protein bthur0013_55680 [Bacillus thuringiensis IBL 200]
MQIFIEIIVQLSYFLSGLRSVCHLQKKPLQAPNKEIKEEINMEL